MIYCTNCGGANEPGAQYCTKCGAPLGALTPERPGEPVPPPIPPAPPFQPSQPFPPPVATPPTFGPPSAGYTPQPGYGPAPPYDPTAKSKLAAGLLGVFLGGFGVHRFYLGFNNIAIAQLAAGAIGLVLLPFTCGLSGFILMGASIWGLVEGVMILTGSISADAQGRPLRD